MLKVKIEILEMPTAEEMKELARARRDERVAKEKFETETNENLARADLPDFLRFINQKIAEVSNKGYVGFSISFDDTYHFGKNIRDERCKFRFNGKFTYELAEEIENIYKNLGYECECSQLCVVNSCCYRIGTFDIRW